MCRGVECSILILDTIFDNKYHGIFHMEFQQNPYGIVPWNPPGIVPWNPSGLSMESKVDMPPFHDHSTWNPWCLWNKKLAGASANIHSMDSIWIILGKVKTSLLLEWSLKGYHQGSLIPSQRVSHTQRRATQKPWQHRAATKGQQGTLTMRERWSFLVWQLRVSTQSQEGWQASCQPCTCQDS